MNTINYTSFSREALIEALKGDYGVSMMDNGLTILKAGRFTAVFGAFGENVSIVQVPSLPERYPLLFCGDSATGAVIVEPENGFVSVPASVIGQRFVIMGFALLNS